MIQKVTVQVLMVDGTLHTVDTILADQIAFSTTRQKHSWPSATEDPILFGSFLAFSAMKRQGLFTGSWPEFCDAVAAIDAEDPSPVDPTPAATL